MIPEYHFSVSSFGYLHLWYFGEDVAIFNLDGKLVALAIEVPLFLVEYLLLQPRPETTRWN